MSLLNNKNLYHKVKQFYVNAVNIFIAKFICLSSDEITGTREKNYTMAIQNFP